MTDPVPSKESFDLLPTRLRIKAARGGVIPIHDITLTEAADEIERLQTALRGIASCSTCEACRGAATMALGGATPEPEAGRNIHLPIATWAQALDIIGQCAEIDAMDDHATAWTQEANKFFDAHAASLTGSAQPPGAGQG